MSLDVLRSLGMTDEQIREKIISKIADDFLRQQQPDLFSEDEDFEGYSDLDSFELTEEELSQRNSEIEAMRKDASMVKLLSTHLRKHFAAQLSGALSQMTTEVVGPILREMIQQKVVQQTNKWGEPVGDSSTVMEFMEKKCKGYLLEDVDKNGRSEDECNQWDRSGWKRTGKRIDVLVQAECDVRVRDAVKEASQAALKAVGDAYMERITSAVTMAIGSIRIDVKK